MKTAKKKGIYMIQVRTKKGGEMLLKRLYSGDYYAAQRKGQEHQAAAKKLRHSGDAGGMNVLKAKPGEEEFTHATLSGFPTSGEKPLPAGAKGSVRGSTPHHTNLPGRIAELETRVGNLEVTLRAVASILEIEGLGSV